MSGCYEAPCFQTSTHSRLQGSALIPSTVRLLRRISECEPSVAHLTDVGIVVSTKYTFPDQIGRGELIALVFEYRGQLRIDIRLEHNRVLSTNNRARNGHHCFLNDFLASTVLPLDADELPTPFVASVTKGIQTAGDAVRIYNERHTVSWLQFGVAVTDKW